MAYSFERPTKATVLAAMMIGALLLALVPPSISSNIRSVIQPLGLLQWPVTALTRGLKATAGWFSQRQSEANQFAALESERDQLRIQVGQQSLLIENLRNQVDRLSGIRAQLGDPTVRILIAPVLGLDSSSRRAAFTIGRGARDDIRVGDWVVAADDTAPESLARLDVLLRQWVVGRVVETSPYQARVRSCVDPEFRGVPVRLAKRQPDGSWLAAPADALLGGIGHDRMQIQKATFDFLRQGFTVVLVPVIEQASGLLVAGEITQSRTLPESALHFDCDVRPWGDYRKLAQVYVISHPK